MVSPEASTLPVIPVSTRAETRAFLVILIVTFGSFLLWGLFAELDAGAVAIGEVIPAGRVRTVQHLEGGIIRTISVRDGDRVKAGDVLLTMDDKELRSSIEIADRELAGYEARLKDVRREVASWSARHDSLDRLATNAEEESRINRGLYEQKFISRPRLLQLESQSAQTSATIGENAAELSRARQKVAEIEAAAAGVRERREIAKQRLSRTLIVAPQDGVINNLKYVTLGGVIPPGGVILDIVPDSEELVIEAKIMPDDIDVVYAGLVTRVKLTAYKARSHITLIGKVVTVSGSTFKDETTQGRPYYKARIEIAPEELKKVDRGILTPGMLAQVDIVSGKRSALRYLFDPILDSVGRAFKEA